MSQNYQDFLEDIIDLCNSQEASWVKLRIQIEKQVGETKPSTKLPFDVSKIPCQDKENEKGKFQCSDDVSNSEHKALLKFLNEHAGGKLTSEGFFFWIYSNGTTIGRKPQRKKGASS